MSRIMQVAAHRGDSYNYYENTMDAFRAGLESGADMIETDVRMSKDGVLVLMHDATVDRTTDGTGAVADLTFEELRRLNAGSRSCPAVIPTFEELLQLLDGRDIVLNIELKEYATQDNLQRSRSCIEQCIRLLEQYGRTEQMLFNSFDAQNLEYIDDHYPGRFRLHGFYPYESEMYRVGRNPDAYLTYATIFDDRNEENYAYLLSRGIDPWIGASVTRENHLQECFELGATLVTTNYPADCLEKLKRIGARHD